ncbi:MAG: Gldg family protein [Myxococcales bacterium]|nr:Gldg family protein [Myxococcales bacterium]
MSHTAPRPPSGSLPMGLMMLGLLTVFIGERVVVDEGLHVLVGWSGAACMIAATAWRCWHWHRAEGSVRHAERTLALSHVGVLLSLALFDLQAPKGLAALGLAAGSSPAVVLKVAWIAVLTLTLAATVAVERAWWTMPVAASVESKRLRLSRFSALKLAFALIFVFSINFAVTQRDIKVDVTFFKTTEPSGTTLDLVKRIEEPVTALLFFAPVSDILPLVRPYFDALAAVSPQLRVQVADHALEPGLAKRYRVRSNGFVVLVRGDPATASGVTASERFEIGEQLAPARRAVRKLDATAQTRLAKLTRAPKRIRFTAGHRERTKKGDKRDPANARLTQVHRLLDRFNIGSDELGLGDGLGAAVPKDATAVIVAGPRRPFLREESESLLRYVRTGGRLLLMIDPRTANQDDGLADLLAQVGLRRLPGTVASTGHHMRSSYSKADRALVYSNTFGSHPSVSSASRNSLRVAAVMKHATAFERTAKVPRGVTVSFPIRTSADFWRDKNADYVRNPKGKAPEHLQILNLMAAVTIKPKTAKGREGRVVVIGDGDFATDALVGGRGNAFVFVDSLRWLIGQDKVGGDLTSEEDIPIEHRKDADRIWFYATTFAFPLALLLIGLWVGRRRRGGGR